MDIEVRVHNKHGDRIDPVPFVVSVALAFMLAMSFGPVYGLSYGFSLVTAVGLSLLGFAGFVAVAYDQLVRSAPPRDAGPLPPGPRVERLLYAAIGIGVILVGLTVPLL